MLDACEPQVLYTKLKLGDKDYRVAAVSDATGKPPHFSESTVADDTELESMVESSGILDRDDQGRWEFYGQASGILFVRSLNGCFQREVFDPRKIPAPDVPEIESLLADRKPSVDFSLTDLPSKEETLALCHTALREVCILLRFIHEPTFYVLVDRIYTCPLAKWDNEQRRALRLLHAVLAIGILFDGRENGGNGQMKNEERLKQG